MCLPFRLRDFAVAALLLTAGNASAHQIWIEQDAKGAALYFGEFRLNLHEDSPGILDKLAKPAGLLIAADGEEQAVVLEKKTTEYVLASRATKGQSLLVEDLAYPVREARGELARGLGGGPGVGEGAQGQGRAVGGGGQRQELLGRGRRAVG
eukprot:gene16930-21583_t